MGRATPSRAELRRGAWHRDFHLSVSYVHGRQARAVPVVEDAVLWASLHKTAPRLVGATCTSEKPVDRGPGREPGPCRRPVWGDGIVDGQRHDLCSACWHEWNAFHGSYQTMKANPASHDLSAESIARLTFTRGNAPALPPVDDAVIWSELDALVLNPPEDLDEPDWRAAA